MPRATAASTELERLHAACGALDEEYLRITAPLALARLHTGLEPSLEDRARIDANRMHLGALERERRQCLQQAAARHPRLRPLCEWFGLDVVDDDGGAPLALDYRPRAAAYRNHVMLRLYFGAEGEPVGARLRLTAALLDSAADGAALRDLLKSVLEVVAAPADAAVRELALQIQCCELPAPLLRHASAPRPVAAPRSPLIDVLRGTRPAASEQLGALCVRCARDDDNDRVRFEVGRVPASQEEDQS